MCELCLVRPRYQQKVNDTNWCDTVAEVFCKNRTIQMLHNGSRSPHDISEIAEGYFMSTLTTCVRCEPLCNICIVLFLQNTSATVSQQFVSFTFCWYRGRTKHNSHICWFPHFLLIVLFLLVVLLQLHMLPIHRVDLVNSLYYYGNLSFVCARSRMQTIKLLML